MLTLHTNTINTNNLYFKRVPLYNQSQESIPRKLDAIVVYTNINTMYTHTYAHTNVHAYICYMKTYIRKQIQVIEGDASLDESERTRRKQASLQMYSNIIYVILYIL